MTEGTRWQFGALIAALVALHFVLGAGLQLGSLAPDLLVVAVLLAARRMRAGAAAGFGLAMGLLHGALHQFSFGAASLVLAVLGYLAARSREVLSGDGPVMLVAYLALGKWTFDAALWLLLATRGLAGPPMALVTASALAALYAAVAGLAAVTAYRVVT